MITHNIISFLKELNENNNREWFNNNKAKYQKAKNDFESFVNSFIPDIIDIDNTIGILEPKDCIFRIFRDVRFSKDKSPYKSNFGSFFVKGGRKSGNAGYYLHIEPNNYFIGGGIHMPPGNILKTLRQEIYDYTDNFKKIINNKVFKTYYGEIDAEKLKSAPRDFPKDFPDIELLKFKSYTVGKRITEKDLLNNNFRNNLKEAFKILVPFIQFLNKAIEYNM